MRAIMHTFTHLVNVQGTYVLYHMPVENLSVDILP